MKAPYVKPKTAEWMPWLAMLKTNLTIIRMTWGFLVDLRIRSVGWKTLWRGPQREQSQCWPRQPSMLTGESTDQTWNSQRVHDDVVLTCQEAIQRKFCRRSLRHRWCWEGGWSGPCSTPQPGVLGRGRRRRRRRCQGRWGTGRGGRAAWQERTGRRCAISIGVFSQHILFLLHLFSLLLCFHQQGPFLVQSQSNCDCLATCVFSCPEQLNRWPCPLLCLLPLTIRVLTALQSEPRDLSPLRHLIRVMRRPDLTISTYLPTSLPVNQPPSENTL